MKLGIIGMSEGNGHPYSWSAICNGYDTAAMAECPFPVIPAYLAEQSWPAARIPGVRVTHIWTQERAISEHIAAAARIPNIVDELTDLIDKIDAVLLARDDPEHHYAMARPFLAAGMPVYVDKPLATDRETARKLYDIAGEGKLFSCSALRYTDELQLSEHDGQQIGDILSVDAVVPKSWEKYAVHVIEPALQLLNNYSEATKVKVFQSGGQRHVSYAFANGQTLSIKTMGSISCPLELRVYGSRGHRTLRFTDAFTAFKAALEAFVQQATIGEPQIPKQQTMAVVHLIEQGLRS